MILGAYFDQWESVSSEVKREVKRECKESGKEREIATQCLQFSKYHITTHIEYNANEMCQPCPRCLPMTMFLSVDKLLAYTMQMKALCSIRPPLMTMFKRRRIH